MRLEYDKQADAIYIYLSDAPYAYGKDLDNERRIDYAADGSPRGVELLCVSEGVNVSDFPYAQEIVKVLAVNGIRAYSVLENEQTLMENVFIKSIFTEFKWPLADQTPYISELQLKEVTA